MWGGALPTFTEGQGELGADPEIVLKIEEIFTLPVVAHQVVGQLNLAGQTEHEIGQVVAGGVGGNRAAGGLSQLSAGRLAELPRVGVQPVYRVDVHHFGVHDML